MRGRMNRDEWLMRARELAPRGQALPQTKLADADVLAIRAAQAQREDLISFIRENLSNAALAEKFGVHRRTIEKVTMRETWAQLL